MRRLRYILTALTCSASLTLFTWADSAPKQEDAYPAAIQQTASMVSNAGAQQLAAAHGLQVMNVTWEDTGRYKGSCVGPNISDMTIQVSQNGQATCMPVIRYNNFADKSADIDPSKFHLLVGNHKGDELTKLTLKDFLGNVRKYMSNSQSWKGNKTSLLAERDTHVLVSAQACFLPVPKDGKADFNPVLFNYQSQSDDPAVLTILATRQGTSVTVIDNKRDTTSNGGVWGQRLFFNKKGERASFTGERLSDFEKKTGDSGNAKTSVDVAGQAGLNMVMLIQVPLKQKKPMNFGVPGSIALYGATDCAQCCACCRELKSNVEAAVIGHGKVEGPFTEIANLDIERDSRFPVRVTVQFYKATSNGVVSKEDMKEISDQINKVYAQADYVGSLVVEGQTGRPTEYDGDKTQPLEWWAKFWERHEANTGKSRDQVIEAVRQVKGPEWTPLTELDLVDTAKEITYIDTTSLKAGEQLDGPNAAIGCVLLTILMVFFSVQFRAARS